ncbi:Leucine rich repeat containing protein BspA family protein [Entamoeba marina]
MLITLNYFKEKKDFITFVQVNKKCQVLDLFHYNPTSDVNLFLHAETQHLYSSKDKILSRFKRHVVNYPVSYDSYLKNPNHKYSQVLLNSSDIFKHNLIKFRAIEIPTMIQRLRSNCFTGKAINKVVFPPSLKIIERNTFKNSGIIEAIFPQYLAYIGG